MSDSELTDRLGQITGEAYGKGKSAEDILTALDEVRSRYERLEEVEP